MQKEKYNLVVLGYNWDVYQYAFREFIDNPRVPYIPTYPVSGLKAAIHRVCFNPRLNKILPIPFKPNWTPGYLCEVKSERNCFLIMENWMRCEHATHLLPYLRSRYPDSKIVCFAQDLVERVRDLYTDKAVDVDYVKRYANLFITYDTIDAERYDLACYPTVYSSVEIKAEDDVPETDLYFLGRDKGRLSMLADMCRRFTEKGLKCHFLLLEVPKEQQIQCPGIVYIDKPIPYRKNLQFVSRTKCVVELLQPNARSATFRMWEAIVLNKKLLTNSPDAKSSPFYDSRYVSVFTGEEDIDYTFVEAGEGAPYEKENPFKDAIRPDALLKFVERQLNIEILR